MSKELDAVLIDAIEKTQAGVGEAVGFALEQAPDVIQQVLIWSFFHSISLFILSAMLCIFWVYMEIICIRGLRKDESLDAEGWFLVYILAGMVPRLILMLAVINAFSITWLKIWIAPKLYLLEYAASLVK